MSVAVIVLLVMVLIIVTPLAGYLLFNAINRKVQELEARAPQEDTLAASELKNLIGTAVRDELDPLNEKLTEQEKEIRRLYNMLGPKHEDDPRPPDEEGRE